MNSRERLLVAVMHRLAGLFKDRLILKGGMLLRLLNSSRSTQDIDYVLLSSDSKKNLVVPLRRALEEIDDLKIIEVRINSRGIFFDLVESGSASGNASQKILIEISVVPSLHLPPEPLDTTSLASQYAMTARIVSTMALPEAFANKIAATLERNVVRDLYDLSVFEPLCDFDTATLQDRLRSLAVRREKPKVVSWQKGAKLLKARLDNLSEEKIERELQPLLPVQKRQGILVMIKASVGRIINRMRSICSEEA